MADLVAAFFGARRQGKSTQVRHFLATRRPARLLVFDPMDEYGREAERVADLRDLGRRATSAPEFRLRYVLPKYSTPKETRQRFDAFCTLAMELGRLVLVVEELQMVTSPYSAPASWSDCTLRGGHRRLTIVGVSQRPASVDGNFLGNANVISSCRLNKRQDVDTVAALLDQPRERVAGLRQHQFLARDMDSGRVVEGHTDQLIADLKRLRPAPAHGRGSMER